jgi:G3E family GTPase
VSERLRRLNPTAPIVEAAFGDVAPAALFDGGERDPRDLVYDDSHEHAHEVRALCVTLDDPLDWTAFGIWLTMLLQARGEDVLRVKGLLDVGAEGPLLLNGVQHVVHPPEHLPAWPDDDRRSRIVFIGRGLDEAGLWRSLEAFNRAAGA